MDRIAQRRFTIILFVIIMFAAAVRLYRLDTYPEHFDQDEEVLAYDAWSIWRTGADHHGVFLPNHFQSFNEYLPGLAQYITAPFVGLLGLNVASSRLPIALLGIGTVFLTGILGRRWFGATAGLLAALLLATEPWHVNFSRLALTNSIAPFFTVLALYTFTCAVESISASSASASASADKNKHYWKWIAFSALAFALLTRTYTPLKLEAPLLFAGCLLASLPMLWGRWRLLTIWLGLYVVFASPQWIDQLIHWNLFQVQFNHNSILSMSNWPMVFLSHYASQYNPSNLFVDGFGGGQSVHPAGVGQLFWLEIFLWVAAAVGLSQRRRLNATGFNLPILMTWWFLIWPVAAALTISGVPTETRTINFLPLPELLAAYGAGIVLDKLLLVQGRLQRLGAYATVAAATIIYLVFNGYFFANYFQPPILERSADEPQPPFAGAPYNTGLAPVLNAVMAQATDCDPIWVEEGTQSYIYFLMFTRYPPEKFHTAKLYQTSVPPDDFLYIPWFNNVRFAPVNTLLHTETFKYQTPTLCAGAHKTFIVMRHEDASLNGTEIAVSKTKSGATLWVAYRQDS